jgi:hypothetical protein
MPGLARQTTEVDAYYYPTGGVIVGIDHERQHVTNRGERLYSRH